ncbi:MAG: coproporphyrinogen III oxidase [Planctomycetota bacterium]|jgi:coproporphyrinogen III oxidase
MSIAPDSERPNSDDVEGIRAHLLDLQNRICEGLAVLDGGAGFREELIERKQPGAGRDGLHRPRVLEGGGVIERAAVHFSHTLGNDLPPAATERRPELVGRAYQALSVSLIVHPRNPFAPTSHANFRFFIATEAGSAPAWWFGGGFDMTPYYGFTEDSRHWHATARACCTPHGSEVHKELKEWCDRYFYLPHRKEQRGIGGIFFDDWDRGGFDAARGLWMDCSEGYLKAYAPILERRKDTEYDAAQRDWQLLRRGRYVEFNLLQDRGTRFGLEAGARTESILASMPPEVRWRYDHHPAVGSEEARLLGDFLVPRDWLAD